MNLSCGACLPDCFKLHSGFTPHFCALAIYAWYRDRALLTPAQRWRRRGIRRQPLPTPYRALQTAEMGIRRRSCTPAPVGQGRRRDQSEARRGPAGPRSERRSAPQPHSPQRVSIWKAVDKINGRAKGEQEAKFGNSSLYSHERQWKPKFRTQSETCGNDCVRTGSKNVLALVWFLIWTCSCLHAQTRRRSGKRGQEMLRGRRQQL